MAATLAALGVVLLALGSLVEVLDLSMAAIASLAVAFAVIELGGKYPLLVYLVTALLALILLPIKTPALFYACFAGYYPILKALFEGRFSRPVSWLFKFLTFLAAMVLTLVLGMKLLFPAGLAWQWWYVALAVPLVLVLWIYDLALTRLITFYLLRLRGRVGFLREK